METTCAKILTVFTLNNFLDLASSLSSLTLLLCDGYVKYSEIDLLKERLFNYCQRVKITIQIFYVEGFIAVLNLKIKK